jgi:hypothetical protein
MPMIQDEQPATTAGACDDETVIVPPETSRSDTLSSHPSIWESELAWSLEESEDAELGPSWRRTAAVAAAVVMVSTAAAGATLLLGRTNGVAQGRVSNATLPTSPTIATTTPPVTITSIVITSVLPAPPSAETPKPPPVTVTTEASPPPRSQDRQFLDALHAAALIPDDPATTIADAHAVCSYLAQGHSEQDAVVSAMSNHPPAHVTWDIMEKLTHIAVQIYCPQYAAG